VVGRGIENLQAYSRYHLTFTRFLERRLHKVSQSPSPPGIKYLTRLTFCSIIHLTKQRLKYYTGNYDMFTKTRMELLENQMKQYNWEQDQIAHMKNYIARFGHGSAKLARQAQSKEKTLAKMVASGLTEKATDDKQLNFCFPSCGTIPPPVIMVRQKASTKKNVAVADAFFFDWTGSKCQL
jgi:ATPase subunit of ABC transporter with duplicated ATPase domains